jgi:hypothetical protein
LDILFPAPYWHFSKISFIPERGAGVSSGLTHYQVIFGPRYEELGEPALTLTVLLDKVVLAPVDAALPDHHIYESGGKYHHPELGLSIDWMTGQEDSKDLSAAIERYLADPELAALLPTIALRR